MIGHLAAMLPPPSTNSPELTVSELSAALKRTLEDRFGIVRLRGEISNYRGPHSSGHAYFCLKDQNARIDAVIWKTTFMRLKVKPEEGLEVIATGKITTYAGKSSYQIVVEAIEPAGLGALMALFEARRRQLASEGLFDEERKRALPFLPAVIGVITSPTGAVIRDILHRITERFPRPVLLWPVRVQGETAAAEVSAAIEGFNALPVTGQGPLHRPDLLIVARGGGSLEDLWGFNEENVVRAAAASSIPLIAAIGHETDWTLIDYAADLRAPTPTGAAEKAVPVRADLLTSLNDLQRRHAGAAYRLLERRRSDLRALARALPQADSLLATPRQRLDRTATRLATACLRAQDQRGLVLGRLAHRLSRQAPHASLARLGQKLEAFGRGLGRACEIAQERRRQSLLHLGIRLTQNFTQGIRVERERVHGRRQKLASLDNRLRQAMSLTLSQRQARLANLAQLTRSLSYHAVLARGFALVRDETGQPLRRAADIIENHVLTLEFSDGCRQAVAGALVATDPPVDPKPTRKPVQKSSSPKPSSRKPKKSQQEDLF
ncbi:exodeoxyribonuclease VII large subunit [Beijerinckia indica]|uniref:Exodeoxyribonuclease 7 large subunit n=1 Tax=Beijerinckia indica subsp. indica (strain ATCC 9039 / DSM 1715 / NCIMB 8712) TaxID=395963 RepID=EX7L_BEII9|nr:exodeoxyribonuclease VII large subunit [Beijerinckia indica]B2IJK8.1 RecName: Full=Exodeoxyribonuclease 7 large subunit; AltName: Full=Exodeoxyribonuclease VII large subunit; Short=Exonuclease VII large subunit [Beijerinckia indica subsp. indica ATCC 9039]ACB94880.1 exodeoxyribonuclease VII, large subunit [Beijerinckia indica subsp. indica ATCC 9039]